MENTIQSQVENIEFQSEDGKTNLVGTFWNVKNAKAWVLWIHGFAEHRLRYGEFARFLNQNQIGFFCFDLRGHGDSDGKRGFILQFEDYLQDVDAAIRQLKNKVDSFFLCGHSMGGLILARYLETRSVSDWVKASVFSCPFLGLGVPVPAWKRKLASLLAKPFPGLSLPSGLDPEYLSHDSEVVNAYIKDPKVFDHATARWFVECLKHQPLALQEANTIPVPVQVMQGTEDRVVKPEATIQFYENLDQEKTKEKNLIQYKGLYHEILNEKQPERKQVYEDIFNWLKRFI